MIISLLSHSLGPRDDPYRYPEWAAGLYATLPATYHNPFIKGLIAEKTEDVWIPASAGMTVRGSLLGVVPPAKAGVQALIRNEVKCCSNYETVNNSKKNPYGSKTKEYKIVKEDR